MFESRISAGATENITGVGKTSRKKQSRGPTTWKDMLENALRDFASWQMNKVEQLCKVSSLCLGNHQF